MASRERRISKLNPRLIEDNSEPWAAQYQARVAPLIPPNNTEGLSEAAQNPSIQSLPVSESHSSPNTPQDAGPIDQTVIPHQSKGGPRPIILDTDTENEDPPSPGAHSKGSLASSKRDAIEVEDSEDEPRIAKRVRRKSKGKNDDSDEETDSTHISTLFFES